MLWRIKTLVISDSDLLFSIPVYPQKQQPYGPYGYAAYPGPYYAGSQYGLPYSQYWKKLHLPA